MNFEQKRLERKEAAQKISQGEDIATVLNEYKRSISWLRSACRENGIILKKERDERKYRQTLNSTTMKVIAELQNTSKNIRTIGNEIGVSYQRVSQIFEKAKKNGIIFQWRKK
jgi:hypothetical protein